MKTLFCCKFSGGVTWSLYVRSDTPPYGNSYPDVSGKVIKFESDIGADRYSTILNIMFREIYTELWTDRDLLVLK